MHWKNNNFALCNRGVSIHQCIVMHRYLVTTISIVTADPSVSRFTLNYMHRYSWKGLIKAHTFFLIRLTEILWYNSTKSHFGSTSGSCSSSYSIHWSSRLCTVLLITGVSAVMLLMMTLWHLTVFRCMYLDAYCIVTSGSRYESYRQAPVLLHPYYAFEMNCKFSTWNFFYFSIPTNFKIRYWGLSEIRQFLHC